MNIKVLCLKFGTALLVFLNWFDRRACLLLDLMSHYIKQAFYSLCLTFSSYFANNLRPLELLSPFSTCINISYRFPTDLRENIFFLSSDRSVFGAELAYRQSANFHNLPARGVINLSIYRVLFREKHSRVGNFTEFGNWAFSVVFPSILWIFFSKFWKQKEAKHLGHLSCSVDRIPFFFRLRAFSLNRQGIRRFGLLIIDVFFKFELLTITGLCGSWTWGINKILMIRMPGSFETLACCHNVAAAYRHTVF